MVFKFDERMRYGDFDELLNQIDQSQ